MKKKLRNKGRYSRYYTSVFGKLQVARYRYHIVDEGNYHPLDDYLSFPRKQLSYKLQSLIGESSTGEVYSECVSIVNRLLGLNIRGSNAARLAGDLGRHVGDYYDRRPGPSKVEREEEGEFLAFGNDGKGVPIVKGDRGKVSDEQKGRLIKGQKRQVKKQATVAVSFSFDPAKRGSEDILRGLFKEWDPGSLPRRETKRISINVHKRAFMCDQKKAIGYAVSDLASRDPAGRKRIVALVDCGSGLEGGILDTIKEQGLEDNLDAIIADVVHVSEYIWVAANAILGERYGGRGKWVRDAMKDLLEGRVDTVIEDIVANRERTRLKDNQKEKLDKVISYLTNHKHKMDYKSYLEKGYPISTGLIEGCCGHLVKDRMEGSGRRWSIHGAQNMLDLRAVEKNGDWEDFMGFVQETNRPDILRMSA